MQSFSEVAEKLPEHSRFAVYELHCHACRSDFRCAVDLAHVADCPVCGNVSRIQVAHFISILMSKAKPNAEVVMTGGSQNPFAAEQWRRQQKRREQTLPTQRL